MTYLPRHADYTDRPLCTCMPPSKAARTSSVNHDHTRFRAAGQCCPVFNEARARLRLGTGGTR